MFRHNPRLSEVKGIEKPADGRLAFIKQRLSREIKIGFDTFRALITSSHWNKPAPWSQPRTLLADGSTKTKNLIQRTALSASESIKRSRSGRANVSKHILRFCFPVNSSPILWACLPEIAINDRNTRDLFCNLHMLIFWIDTRFFRARSSRWTVPTPGLHAHRRHSSAKANVPMPVRASPAKVLHPECVIKGCARFFSIPCFSTELPPTPRQRTKVCSSLFFILFL